MILKLAAMSILAVAPAAVWAAPVDTSASSASSATGVMTQPDNVMFARQYRVAAVRGMPGLSQGAMQGGALSAGAQPTVTAYQVTQGSWNGQALGGLSIVVVAPAGDDARAHRSVIVSNLATPAQRDALIAAFSASFPDAVGQVTDLESVQSAVIEMEEIAPRQYVLHIALLA